MKPLPPWETLLPLIKDLHESIRDRVVEACERSATEALSAIAREEEGDTIYAVDRVSEEILVEFFEKEIASTTPVVLIGEGLPGGKIVLPRGATEGDAGLRIIVDPIDGTRGLMYQKRSAWILTGVARNHGEHTNLSHIELAVQTEIPLVKQHLSDCIWAIQGQGAHAERFNRVTGERWKISLQPSRQPTIAHGYAGIVRFFPGARDELAAIDEEVVLGALGPTQPGKAHCFEDQYTSTGGQLYELMSGHDRFIADLRPLMSKTLNERGLPVGICCHPYDLCTELIAREAGVIVTDVDGHGLSAPLAVEPDVAWTGYANYHVREQIEPLLRKALFRRGLVEQMVESRAPGRIDLMGGIADYSGSLVLQWPIAAATRVRLQLQAAPVIQIVSQAAEANRLFDIPLAELASHTYESAQAMFKADPGRHWAAYVAGAFLVLMRERNFVFDKGAKMSIWSDVPEGKGVSSSAALEVAAMMAIAGAYEIALSPSEVAFLSQKVENLVAGAPCGVMDQFTAACGEQDRLLAILCQPGELKGTISLPEELTIWGIDSGIRHSVAGADYGIVRTAAFMGYRIITELAGFDYKYLANITPEEFENKFAAQLPREMSGKSFLDRYQGITDTATSVDPNQTYPVFAATSHPIYENARVQRFAAILKNWNGVEDAKLLGELMYQSHRSYSDCGLGSGGTDELVRLVREAGPERGLYGAKITGGGSGGTVAVLGHRSAEPVVDEIAKIYAQQTGNRPTIISGSSPGAAKYGILKI